MFDGMYQQSSSSLAVRCPCLALERQSQDLCRTGAILPGDNNTSVIAIFQENLGKLAPESLHLIERYLNKKLISTYKMSQTAVILIHNTMLGLASHAWYSFHLHFVYTSSPWSKAKYSRCGTSCLSDWLQFFPRVGLTYHLRQLPLMHYISALLFRGSCWGRLGATDCEGLKLHLSSSIHFS